MAFYAHLVLDLWDQLTVLPLLLAFHGGISQNPNLSVHPLLSLPLLLITPIDLICTLSSVIPIIYFMLDRVRTSYHKQVLFSAFPRWHFQQKIAWCIPNLAKMLINLKVKVHVDPLRHWNLK